MLLAQLLARWRLVYVYLLRTCTYYREMGHAAFTQSLVYVLRCWKAARSLDRSSTDCMVLKARSSHPPDVCSFFLPLPTHVRSTIRLEEDSFNSSVYLSTRPRRGRKKWRGERKTHLFVNNKKLLSLSSLAAVQCGMHGMIRTLHYISCRPSVYKPKRRVNNWKSQREINLLLST